MEENDPLENREFAHPKAIELMKYEFLWDVVDEDSPFGSDEGWDAYYEFRRWRNENPDQSLLYCMSWILQGRENEYSERLLNDDEIKKCMQDNDYHLNFGYDIYSLDTTIIASALGQLINEGYIDADVKPIIRIALQRQLNPLLNNSSGRNAVLKSIADVVEAA